MNERIKAILGLAIIALGVAAGWGWLGPTPKGVRADPQFWWGLRTLPIAVLVRPNASFFTLHRDPAITITADIHCSGGEPAGPLPRHVTAIAFRAFQLVAALTGRYVNFAPATLRVHLPDNVHTSADDLPAPRQIILWTLGQSPSAPDGEILRLLRGAVAADTAG